MTLTGGYRGMSGYWNEYSSQSAGVHYKDTSHPFSKWDRVYTSYIGCQHYFCLHVLQKTSKGLLIFVKKLCF